MPFQHLQHKYILHFLFHKREYCLANNAHPQLLYEGGQERFLFTITIDKAQQIKAHLSSILQWVAQVGIGWSQRQSVSIRKKYRIDWISI